MSSVTPSATPSAIVQRVSVLSQLHREVLETREQFHSKLHELHDLVQRQHQELQVVDWQQDEDIDVYNEQIIEICESVGVPLSLGIIDIHRNTPDTALMSSSSAHTWSDIAANVIDASTQTESCVPTNYFEDFVADTNAFIVKQNLHMLRLARDFKATEEAHEINLNQKKRVESKLQDVTHSLHDILQRIDDANSLGQCSICLSTLNPPSVAVFPCGHRVFCLSCAPTANLSECPCCRMQIHFQMRVY